MYAIGVSAWLNRRELKTFLRIGSNVIYLVRL
jgi:hypothetical protein